MIIAFSSTHKVLTVELYSFYSKDKDPEAMKDTRPVGQSSNLVPQVEKSEMELMIEKHASGSDSTSIILPLHIPIPPGLSKVG